MKGQKDMWCIFGLSKDTILLSNNYKNKKKTCFLASIFHNDKINNEIGKLEIMSV